MVSDPTHAEELFQMRLLLEQQLLSADLDDEQAVAGLLQQVDWLQACCGERQLTPEAVAATATLLQDADAAVRQQAASTLSLQASRSVFNRFRIAARPGVTHALVQLLHDEESWVRGSAAAALTHLAMGGCAAMQSKIGQAPGATTALVQMLHDTDAGLGCAAALALRTLAQGHPTNQTRIGLEPGAISGLVAMALGQQQPGALQAMAAAALKRLADNHPVNRARIRRESSSFCEYYWPAGVGVSLDVWGGEAESASTSCTAAVAMHPTKQQQQQQHLVRWQGLLAERGQQQQQHVCVV